MQENSEIILERKWVKPSQISKHLNCSICDEVFINPRRLLCSHTFCERCIKQWFNNQKTCPQCRKSFKLKDMGKDLLAEKIINDLEVFCINDKYCKWKDKLELLTRHVEVCEFQDKNLKDWLQGFEKITAKPTENQPLVYYQNESLQERINNEIPKAPLLARLYAKDSSSKALFTDMTQKVEQKENVLKSKDHVFDLLEGILNNNDEVKEEEDKKIEKEKEKEKESNSEEKSLNEAVVREEMRKINIDDYLDEKELLIDLRDENTKDKNDENKNPLNIKNDEEEGLDITSSLDPEISKKRKCKEPILILKLKQMKS